MNLHESSVAFAPAREMAARWRCGERPLAEEFFSKYPELRDNVDAAIDLIYEEFCLRHEFNLPDTASALLERFPQWREQLKVMFGFHQILEPHGASSTLPAIDDVFGNFRLIAELGRGGRGHVYLATQSELADRPVVLKVTSSVGTEHLSLARLQHTHISPLYSVQDYPDLNLRALCMPYFGGATLARVIEQLRGIPATQRSGQHILAVLDDVQNASPVTLPARGPARQFFSHASYSQSVCWLGACLADALQYAHERGLVHLDVKPSNILIACDGQPMLLDFHLARAPIAPEVLAPEWLGGTAGYMSPEQELAVMAVRRRQPVPEAVDGRSDIFSLGLVLYEALGGSVPADSAPGRLDRINPQVSVGLADIIAQCIAADPADRYATAAALSADLRCHLADVPLRGVPNRSVVERWRKWKRRRPHALALANLTTAATVAVLAALTIFVSNTSRRADEARAALTEGQDHLEKEQFAESIDAFERGVALCDSPFGQGALKLELRTQLRVARRAKIAADLHRLADHMRFLYANDLPTLDSVRPLEARCREVLADQEWIASNLELSPVTNSHQQLATDLLDLAILWADLHVRVSAEADIDTARQQAIQVLDHAESVFGPSSVLCYERRKYTESLGLADPSLDANLCGNNQPPRTAWEHYALGRSLFARRRFDEAANMFDRAVALDPTGLWPNFYQGVCACRRGRYDDAAIAFTACVGAAPQLAGCYYNRALAYAELGRSDRAFQDYDRALKLDPSLAAAALNRAILYYHANQFIDAAADLDRALKYGANPASVYGNLALVHLAQGDRTAALDDLEKSLQHDPSQQQARTLREQLLREW